MKTDEQILKYLEDGFMTVRSLSERLGLHKSSVQSQLQKLEFAGLVSKHFQGRELFYGLSNGARPASVPELPDVAPLPVLPTDRVALAEELVELERRRKEILELLSK